MKSRFKMRIRTKMLLFVLLTSILILSAIGIYIQYRTYTMAENDAEIMAKNYAENMANQIKAELDLDVGFSRALAHAFYGFHKLDSMSRDSLYFNIVRNQVEQNPRYITVWYNFEYSAIRNNYKKSYGRRSISAFLKDGESQILIEHKNVTGDNTTSGYYKAKSTNTEIILDPYPYSFDGVNEFLVTSMCVPIRRNGNFVGLAGVDILLDKFQNNIKKINPYPNTVSYLLSHNGTVIAHTNPNLAGKSFAELYPEIEAEHKIDSKVKRGSDYTFTWNENNEVRVHFIAPIHIEGTNTPWSIGLSIPRDAIMVEARNAMVSGIFVALIGLIILGIVLYYISSSITKPIHETTMVLSDLAKGDIDRSKALNVQSGDELEEMANSVNQLIEGLNQTENFAREIGRGNLDAQFQLLGPKDILGISLLEMQKSLIHAREFENERKEEEQKQNWATQGMALFGDILRQNSNNIKDFTFSIIQNLVGFTNSNLGGVYIINDNEKDHPVLEMTACYAYDRRKYLQKVIEVNEGLIGRCYREQKTIFMTQVPEDYIKITSGLGKERPRCLIIVPLKTNDDILGVLEIASFREYQSHEVDFIEKIAESIAATIANVRINIRTAELLAKSQQQAEEMLAQEEEMRQNMEELQATQEEMERKRHEQERIQETLNQELSLLNALMQNIPDFVYFKDTNSRFLRISKSMVKLFNANTTDDLIGKSDFDFHSQEHAQKAFMEEQDIMRTLSPIVDNVVHEQFDDGRDQWVSTTKMPLVNTHGEVIGVWGISKVVTDLKRAEIIAQEKANEATSLKQKLAKCEEEYKAVVKALDSSTLVAEFLPNGTFIRINKPMSKLLGISETGIAKKLHSSVLRMKGESDSDYENLWSDLQTGIIRTRLFKGIINNEKVSLNETYSPIVNTRGEVDRIILIAFKS